MAISKENKVLRDKAVGLRKEGLSLLEIMKDIPRPKGTVYHWIKDVELTKIQKARLDKNSKDILLASQKMATEAMCKKYETIRREWFEKGQAYINGFDVVPEDVVAAVCLYWGEGRKTNHLSIANGDPSVLLVFKKFLLERLNISEEKIKVRLNFYDNMHTQAEVENYWQQTLNLDSTHFYKSQINNKPQEKAGNKIGKLPYGVCSITAESRNQLQHMLGMMDALKAKLLS